MKLFWLKKTIVLSYHRFWSSSISFNARRRSERTECWNHALYHVILSRARLLFRSLSVNCEWMSEYFHVKPCISKLNVHKTLQSTIVIEHWISLCCMNASLTLFTFHIYIPVTMSIQTVRSVFRRRNSDDLSNCFMYIPFHSIVTICLWISSRLEGLRALFAFENIAFVARYTL